ncbi:hypothetical protein DPMN_011284, partial [Dreissena polymorpha]
MLLQANHANDVRSAAFLLNCERYVFLVIRVISNLSGLLRNYSKKNGVCFEVSDVQNLIAAKDMFK